MIIFLHGTDGFRSHQKLEQLRKKFCKNVSQAQTSIENFGNDVSWEKLHQALFTFGFLATKRLVIIKNLLREPKDDEVIPGLIKNYDKLSESEKITLIFLEETIKKSTKGKKEISKEQQAKKDKASRISKKLFTKLMKEKFCQEFKKMNQSQLINWIKSEVEARGGKIDMNVASKLARLEDDDLWRISNVLDSLIAYRDGAEIKDKDLDLFLTSKVDDNIFDLVDAIVQGQERKALQLINEQLDSGVHWGYLINMISRQFGILAMLCAEIEKGDFVQSKDLAKKLKLHPYVVQKGLTQARQYPLEKLQDIYKKLIVVDGQLKRGGNQNVLLSLLAIKK